MIHKIFAFAITNSHCGVCDNFWRRKAFKDDKKYLLNFTLEAQSYIQIHIQSLCPDLPCHIGKMLEKTRVNFINFTGKQQHEICNNI